MAISIGPQIRWKAFGRLRRSSVESLIEFPSIAETSLHLGHKGKPCMRQVSTCWTTRGLSAYVVAHPKRAEAQIHLGVLFLGDPPKMVVVLLASLHHPKVVSSKSDWRQPSKSGILKSGILKSGSATFTTPKWHPQIFPRISSLFIYFFDFWGSLCFPLARQQKKQKRLFLLGSSASGQEKAWLPACFRREVSAFQESLQAIAAYETCGTDLGAVQTSYAPRRRFFGASGVFFGVFLFVCYIYIYVHNKMKGNKIEYIYIYMYTHI